ncbi:MAG: hypothetical protein AYL28_003620 [Candidatus Bathyarchaeota archaeon B23]|nr:MAG: hypothetical protein AYL28_003620 [Candidatus Bathyarchaeota archaeon B23]
MACFLVPLVLAAILTILQRATGRAAERLQLGLLNTLLWGGVILLMFEHIWHGEVVPWPPFLTAMANPADIPAMLQEMAVIGSAMLIAVTSTWGVVLTLSRRLPKIAIGAFREMERP